MALPTGTEVVTLKFASRGGPFCRLAAKAGIDTTKLGYAILGGPFAYAPESGSAPPAASGALPRNVLVVRFASVSTQYRGRFRTVAIIGLLPFFGSVSEWIIRARRRARR